MGEFINTSNLFDTVSEYKITGLIDKSRIEFDHLAHYYHRFISEDSPFNEPVFSDKEMDEIKGQYSEIFLINKFN